MLETGTRENFHLGVPPPITESNKGGTTQSALYLAASPTAQHHFLLMHARFGCARWFLPFVSQYPFPNHRLIRAPHVQSPSRPKPVPFL
ncbi:hypothetical protein TNCV_475241 [Trichonephila clavipes]|nr:hypothetical protein TNCV_475241 [Trichonephila clavipes]